MDMGYSSWNTFPFVEDMPYVLSIPQRESDFQMIDNNYYRWFHVTSYQANFASRHTCDSYFGFLLHGWVLYVSLPSI